MTISSLNTNLAALSAQLNISNATAATASHVSALSSGSRIVHASDDVAALAAGTALSSQVNTLNTSLTVASQGSSLLQVADGALSQIQSILQRQQAISTQAQSGSLSTTQLGFLNQEFTQLSSQIDQLAGTTNFNGVNLINGSISGQVGLTTNTTNQVSSISSNTSATILTIATQPVDGDTVTIQGVKVTFSTSAQGTSSASGKVVVGSDADHTAQNLAAYLNKLGAPQLANLEFADSGSGALVAKYTGGTLLGSQSIISSTSNTTNITGTGTAAISATTAAKNADGLTIDRYSVAGNVTGSILATGDSTAQTGGAAIDVSTLHDNASFIGAFGGPNVSAVSGTFTGTNGQGVFKVTAGNIVYTSAPTTLGSAGNVVGLTFTGHDASGLAAGGSFKLNLNGSIVTNTNVTSQQQLDPYIAQINQAISGVAVNQNRTIANLTNGNLVTNGSVVVGNLQGLSAQLKTSNFSTPNISSITVTAPATGSTDATITAVINGDTYVSGSGIGNQIGLNTVIGLQDTSNPANTFSIVTGNTAIPSNSTTALDISSASKAAALQTALQTGFGLNNANASLTFQVGSSSTATLGVSIGSATSSALFNGQTLDVSTQADAATAEAAVGNALNTVTALRANVGALEERFNYASNAIQSAVQNEGAAQSTLLDTDVASESTKFATSQVQLQAGIAVLAQANQLQQTLVKLL